MLLVATALLAYYIAKPFLTAIVAGAIISYLSYPLYKKTLKFIRNKNVASLLFSIFIVLIFTVPFILVVGIVSKEAYQTYTTLNRQNLGTNFIMTVCADENSLVCKTSKTFTGLLPEVEGVKAFESHEAKLDYYLQLTVKKITEFIILNFSKFVVSLPSILLNFFVMMFIVYYLLKDGESIASKIKTILPMKDSHKKEVLQRFHDLTHGTFYGNIAVAIIQGILGAIGLFVLGADSPILWGFVMIFFAFIPYFGTAIIWLPIAVNMIFMGYLQNNTLYTINGIILIIYGILIVGTIDNLLKPKLISSKAKVHPILVLIGILGGLSLFGFIGIILGPVMLALLMTFIGIYTKEKEEIGKYF